MIESSILFIFLIALTFLSGFFSGSEVALFSLSPIRLKTYRTHPNWRRRLLAQLLEQPKELLVTVFMLNTLVNILLQNVASKMFGMEAGWILKVGVPLLLTLFIGEIIPKNVCIHHNVAIADLIIPVIDVLHRGIAPLRRLTTAVTNPVSRFLFFFLKKEESISEDELQHVLKTSEQDGILTKDESTLVRGYLKLHHSTAKEIMVPEEDILYYEIHEPLSKLMHLFAEEECTRIPVCKGSLDEVLGIISAKQFFLHGHKIKEGKELKRLLFKPFYIPETTPTEMLMRQFDEKNHIVALVVDEYGSVTGLVSREDIAELVVGEIVDKRDEKPLYTVAGKDEIIASGKLELADLNRLFQTHLASEMGMVTLGGWLMEKIGDIPRGGATFEFPPFHFQILQAEPNKIKRIYVRKQHNGRRE